MDTALLSSGAPQEAELRERELQSLGAELARLLSKDDLELITQHYFRGVPQRTLAKQLLPEKYEVDPKQAETTLNVRMIRARQRLAQRLPARWRQLVTEN